MSILSIDPLYGIILQRMIHLKKGFNITCLECNEEIKISKGFLKEDDESNITYSVMGSYPFHSLYLVCSNCGNELEVDV
ncbi:hypothetical protein OXB_2960 [Bacillus sp. OxB-1]|nr:hypothetical protein OXB_2960 [Bacillus sp. OxB-1]